MNNVIWNAETCNISFQDFYTVAGIIKIKDKVKYVDHRIASLGDKEKRKFDENMKKRTNHDPHLTWYSEKTKVQYYTQNQKKTCVH